jgi:hypothetical protein
LAENLYKKPFTIRTIYKTQIVRDRGATLTTFIKPGKNIHRPFVLLEHNRANFTSKHNHVSIAYLLDVVQWFHVHLTKPFLHSKMPYVLESTFRLLTGNSIAEVGRVVKWVGEIGVKWQFSALGRGITI